jgi:alpha/beta superfamily hydrolase
MRAVVCVGLAVAWGDLSHLGHWHGPKLFITGERDDFCPPELLEKFVAQLPAPTTQVVLKNTGHFFEGREEDLGSAVAQYLRNVL